MYRNTHASVGLNSNINSQIHELLSEVGWAHRARAGTAYHNSFSSFARALVTACKWLKSSLSGL